MELWLVAANVALICLISRIDCDDQNIGQSRSFMTSSSSSQTLSSANGFSVSSSESSVNGRCVARIIIYGNGIYKVIDSSCASKPATVINLDKKLLLGNEFFSERYGELVTVHAGRCDRETFHYYRDTNQYTSTITATSKGECDRIRASIERLRQTQRRWDEWYKTRQQETQTQLLQVQSNLASLQQQFFSSIFGSGGF